MSTLISISVTRCWFNTSWMRNLVVHCNPHTHAHTHTRGRSSNAFSVLVKIIPRRKSFRNNTQYREKLVAFSFSRRILHVKHDEERKGLHSLRLRSLSLSFSLVSTECKIMEHEGGRKGRVSGRLAGHAQQSGTDLWRKLLCLGPPERESRYPTFPCI